MGGKKQKITLGIALAIAILAAIEAVWIAVPLLLISVLLFFWGLEPKRTEAFAGRLPYIGNYILKALAELDRSSPAGIESARARFARPRPGCKESTRRRPYDGRFWLRGEDNARNVNKVYAGSLNPHHPFKVIQYSSRFCC